MTTRLSTVASCIPGGGRPHRRPKLSTGGPGSGRDDPDRASYAQLSPPEEFADAVVFALTVRSASTIRELVVTPPGGSS